MRAPEITRVSGKRPRGVRRLASSTPALPFATLCKVATAHPVDVPAEPNADHQPQPANCVRIIRRAASTPAQSEQTARDGCFLAPWLQASALLCTTVHLSYQPNYLYYSRNSSGGLREYKQQHRFSTLSNCLSAPSCYPKCLSKNNYFRCHECAVSAKRSMSSTSVQFFSKNQGCSQASLPCVIFTACRATHSACPQEIMYSTDRYVCSGLYSSSTSIDRAHHGNAFLRMAPPRERACIQMSSSTS